MGRQQLAAVQCGPPQVRIRTTKRVAQEQRRAVLFYQNVMLISLSISDRSFGFNSKLFVKFQSIGGKDEETKHTALQALRKSVLFFGPQMLNGSLPLA